MSDRLIRDNPVSDEQIQAWADEAERGYDLTKLAPPAPGPSPSGERPGRRRHEAGASSRLRWKGVAHDFSCAAPRVLKRRLPLTRGREACLLGRRAQTRGEHPHVGYQGGG